MAYAIKKRGSTQTKDKRTLQRLRREAGFKSAKEFADGPESRIPMKVAWVMADVFGCTIDLVVGREDIDEDERSVQFQYNHLSKSSQERFDEYMEFLQYRDRERGYKARRKPR